MSNYPSFTMPVIRDNRHHDVHVIHYDDMTIQGTQVTPYMNAPVRLNPQPFVHYDDPVNETTITTSQGSVGTYTNPPVVQDMGFKQEGNRITLPCARGFSATLLIDTSKFSEKELVVAFRPTDLYDHPSDRLNVYIKIDISEHKHLIAFSAKDSEESVGGLWKMRKLVMEDAVGLAVGAEILDDDEEV